jgi:hypothetical protein
MGIQDTSKFTAGFADGECPKCQGIGTVCLNCNEPIDDCECGEDAMPCPCEECQP